MDMAKKVNCHPSWRLLAFIAGMLLLYFLLDQCFGADIPGKDESAKLEAAGTLLRLVDTGLFKWGARLFAGLCVMSSGWAIKEQRFGVAVICIVGAIIFGTSTMWVKNIFAIGADTSLFGALNNAPEYYVQISRSSEGDYGSLR